MTSHRSPTARQIRQQFADDRHRPRYHYLPPSNWMNDPNGLIQWDGKYHLFYQHNPFEPVHGNIHWGHAVSDDLVHWQDLLIALTPTPEGPDKDGCWSGCAVNHAGVPTLIYTGAFPENQCIATGSADLVKWDKLPGNPVISAPPDGLKVTGFRDPCVWREADTWYMVLGSGIKAVGGMILLYRSTDLHHWEYMHPLYTGDDPRSDMWECPSFFPLGGKHVLMLSLIASNTTEYLVGTYQDFKFEPEFRARLDHTTNFYAPHSFLDDQGRRLILGWILEARDTTATTAAGWAGVMSVPRILTLRPDGKLGISPASELQILRDKHTQFTDVTLSPATSHTLGGWQSDSLELMLEFEARTATQYGVNVLRAPGGEEETTIIYDQAAQRLRIDRTRSCVTPEGIDITPQSAPLTLSDDEPLQLHIFVDRSVIEVFANGHTVLTSRVYPTQSDSMGVELFSRDGSVTVKHAAGWSLNSIW